MGLKWGQIPYALDRLTLMMATPVAAAECPAAPDHGDVLASLIAKVQSVQNEAAARQINREMWLLWRDAPDAPAQRLLDCGIERREAYDYDAALGELVAYFLTMWKAITSRRLWRFTGGLRQRAGGSGACAGIIPNPYCGIIRQGAVPDGIGPDGCRTGHIARGIGAEPVVAGTLDADPARGRRYLTLSPLALTNAPAIVAAAS